MEKPQPTVSDFIASDKFSQASLRLLLGAAFLAVFQGCAALSGSHPPLNSNKPPLSAQVAVVSLPAVSYTGIRSIPGAVTLLPVPELPITPEVRVELVRYLGQHRRFIEDALDRRQRFYPMMQEIFRDEGVPEDLLALSLIESGYDPKARSSAGATGLWQFMKGTARGYGLSVTSKEDQRKDPVLSTLAAARYLKDLYRTHNDWHLALASYNAGAGGVSRALTRTGATDYWTLVRRRVFCEQTNRFVPKFIAAALIARRMNRYGIDELAANLSLLQDVPTNGSEQIAYRDGDGHSPVG